MLRTEECSICRIYLIDIDYGIGRCCIRTAHINT